MAVEPFDDITVAELLNFLYAYRDVSIRENDKGWFDLLTHEIVEYAILTREKLDSHKHQQI